MKTPTTRTLLLAATLTACTSSSSGPGPGGNPPAIQPLGTFEAVDGVRLEYPVRVAVAADGVLYTSDYAGDRVLGLKDGAVVVALTNIAQPLGVAVAGDLLYVGSGGRRTVEVYDLAAKKGVAAVGGIDKPNAIAVAADGAIYVVDSKNDRVVVLGRDLATVATLGGRGSGEGQLFYPISVAVDAERVVVGDQGNHRLAIFDRRGAFVRNVGAEMTAGKTVDDYRGRFTAIGSVALAGDDIYVLDTAHSYVQVLDGRGNPRGFLGHAGECESCVKLALDIAVAADGRLIATDPEHRRLVTLSTEMR